MNKAFKYLTILAFINLFSACAKEEDRNSTIPDRRVLIDINITLEHNFDNPYYSKKYYKSQTTPDVGYAGVLAISSAEKNIYAYDLCCPHEAPLINEIKIINDLQAQCPKCKSIFEIADGTGRVTSGPSTERLKSYRVYKEGSWFRIRN